MATNERLGPHVKRVEFMIMSNRQHQHLSYCLSRRFASAEHANMIKATGMGVAVNFRIWPVLGGRAIPVAVTRTSLNRLD